MCGFVGYLGGEYSFHMSAGESVLRSMADTISSRGPDDSGYWCHPEQVLGLAHRRLSVIDVSPAGHQPMRSMGGRYTIVFNGEIYNHLQLRKEIESICEIPGWRGHADTETLLAGFEAWGVQETVDRVTGMFAFSVWDHKENVLILGRDRVGEKPLYFGWQDNTFLFGSELKALKKHHAFRSEINRNAITLLLRHNYIPAPYSIYQGISKLSPGCLLKVSLAEPDPKVWPYWSATDVAIAGVRQPFKGTANDAVDQLEYLTMDAISQQMVADVPIGAFLSGGIDSSAVVALMQAQSDRPVKTFSIGFYEKGYNEAEHAKAVARRLGTEHTELYVSPEDAMNVIPDLPKLYCEPFSDSSQIPTFLVSQLAKQHVTVALSGDAGDELFCGYNRYQMTNRLWRMLSMLPVPIRALLAKLIVSFTPQNWNNIADIIPGLRRLNNVGDKFHKGADLLTSRSMEELYLRLVSHFRDPASIVIGSHEPPTLLTDNLPDLVGFDDVQRMMMLDLVTYLPDDILVKVDRAAMGVSLESRVPFLDHRVVEYAWSLPQSIKFKDSISKWPLRQLLYRHVPQKLIERPKMGFGVPIDSWLRGPLREWAEGLLDVTRLRQEGFFDPAPIHEKWAEHLSGKRNWQHHLWDVLMFQAWLEEQNF